MALVALDDVVAIRRLDEYKFEIKYSNGTREICYGVVTDLQRYGDGAFTITYIEKIVH